MSAPFPILPLRWCFAAIIALMAGLGPSCGAHQWSEASIHFSLAHNQLHGLWSVDLRDLEDTIGLDANGDREITWGEVQNQRERILTLARKHLRLEADGQGIALAVDEILIEDHYHWEESDLVPDGLPPAGANLVLSFSVELPAGTHQLTVEYDFLFELDPEHRGRLRLRMDNRTLHAVFQPKQTRWEYVLPRN